MYLTHSSNLETRATVTKHLCNQICWQDDSFPCDVTALQGCIGVIEPAALYWCSPGEECGYWRAQPDPAVGRHQSSFVFLWSVEQHARVIPFTGTNKRRTASFCALLKEHLPVPHVPGDSCLIIRIRRHIPSVIRLITTSSRVSLSHPVPLIDEFLHLAGRSTLRTCDSGSK